MTTRAAKPPKRVRLSPAARRAQIIEAARVVFTTSGANRARVRTIADHAGITEPFLYRHFESREELFKLAILDPLDAIVEKLALQMKALVARTDISRDEMLRLFHEQFLRDVIEMVPLIAAAQFSDPVEGPKFYSDTLFPRIRDNVAALMSRFTGWDMGSTQMDLAIQAVMGVHFGIALENVLGGGKLDIARVTHDLTRMFAPGLTATTLPTARASAAKAAARASRSDAAKECSGVAAVAWLAADVDTNLLAGKRRLPRSERAEAILLAARDTFLQHGFTGARSKDIALQAGITEAFMFRFFSTKELMYDAAILSPLETAFATLARDVQFIGATVPGTDFLARLNQRCLPFFIDNGPLCSTALFSELTEGRRYYRTRLAPHLKTIRDEIMRRVGPTHAEVDPETVRRAIIGAQWGISFDYKLRFSTLETDRIVTTLTRLFTAGVQHKPVPRKR